MATFFVAEILPEHYDSFRRVLNQSLPNTFDAWVYQHSERVAKLTGKGHTVYEVKVNPEEFIRYYHVTNSVRDLQPLDRFASEKASGKRY